MVPDKATQSFCAPTWRNALLLKTVLTWWVNFTEAGRPWHFTLMPNLAKISKQTHKVFHGLHSKPYETGSGSSHTGLRTTPNALQIEGPIMQLLLTWVVLIYIRILLTLAACMNIVLQDHALSLYWFFHRNFGPETCKHLSIRANVHIWVALLICHWFFSVHKVLWIHKC